VGKAILFLIVIVVLGVGFVLFKGSQVAVPSAEEAGGDSTESSGASILPGYDLKNKTVELAGKIKVDVKNAAVSTGAINKPLVLKFDREVLELKAGAKADVRVIRGGGDMAKALKLDVIAAPRSGLTATSASEFPANSAAVVITITASADSQDSGVTVRTGEVSKVLPVKVIKP